MAALLESGIRDLDLIMLGPSQLPPYTLHRKTAAALFCRLKMDVPSVQKQNPFAKISKAVII